MSTTRSRTTSRFRFATAIVAAITLAASACGSSSSPSSSTSASGATSVKILSYPTSGSSWVEYIAQKEGFFAKNGIDATLVSLPAGQQGTAALVGGSIDIGLLDTNNLGPLLAKGGKYTLITNAIQNYWVLMGEKDLAGESLGDALNALKGKGIAVPSLGGSGARELELMLSAYGLSTSSVSLVADPTTTSFTTGRVGGFMNDTLGSCSVTAKGYPTVMNFVNPPAAASSYPADVQKLIGLAGLGFWASDSWLSSHAGFEAKFQKAIAETISWAQQSSNLNTIAQLFRGTTWDTASLTASQWTSCTKEIVATFSDKYSSNDVSTWNEILKAEGVSSLPAASEFIAQGVPQS